MRNLVHFISALVIIGSNGCTARPSNCPTVPSSHWTPTAHDEVMYVPEGGARPEHQEWICATPKIIDTSSRQLKADYHRPGDHPAHVWIDTGRGTRFECPLDRACLSELHAGRLPGKDDSFCEDRQHCCVLVPATTNSPTSENRRFGM